MKLLRPFRRPRSRRGEQGYMLLFLMLAVAVLTITMLEVAYDYRRTILRDREVEMIHRGEQYERAVRRFYRKNGRYPVSLEQLENFNKVRYLRKRYKDPMSPNGEWKLVHATDVKLTATGVAAANTPVNGNAAGNVTGTQQSGDSSGASGSGTTAADANTAGGSSASGDSSGSAFGNSSSASAFGGSSSSSSQGTTASGGLTSSTGNAANGQTLGGGDVYGVVSSSKKTGFHIYGEKSKYNEWFFIYVPAQDRGQLLIGPYNPKAYFGAHATATGTNGSTGTGTGNTPGTGLGTSQGTGFGFGSTGSSGNSGGSTSSGSSSGTTSTTTPNQ